MKNWKSVLKEIAPTIATAMGGPLAGMATKALGEGLLGDGEAREEDIVKAMLNPEGLMSLKKVESDFKVKMKELEIDVYRLGVEDRKNARDLAKSTSILPQSVMSGIFITGFFAVLWLLISEPVQLSPVQENIAYTLIGVLGTSVTLILKFWFGGSPHDAQNLQNTYNSIPRDQLKKS